MDKKLADSIKYLQKHGISLNFAGDTPPAKTKTAKKVSGVDAPILYLDETEIGRLFLVLKEHGTVRDRAIFTVGFHRGLRASEVGLLKMSDYRPKIQRLYVTRLKGSMSADYLITKAEQDALTAWLRVRGTGPGPLFASRNRKPIHRRTLDDLAKKYMGLAQIDKSRKMWKSLRHACGTALVDRGVDAFAIQDHLGHKDIKNTQRYAKLRNKQRDAVAEGLRGWKG